MKPQHQTQTAFGPAPMILKFVQTFFKITGRLAPGLALKALWRFIFYTRKKSFKPPHNELIKSAKLTQFKVRVDKVEQPTANLTAYRWGSSKRKVFLVHGWEAHSLDFYKMIPALLDAGFEVIAFDAPAHGKSEGTEVNLIAVKQAIHQAILRFGIPYAVIGHSFGGYASSFTLSDYPIEVEKFIMISSPIFGKNMFEQICDALGVPRNVRNRLFAALKNRFERTIDSFNLVELNQPIKAQEIHYLYDRNDEMVNYEDVEALLEAHPHIKSKEFEKVGHFRMPRNTEVIDHVVDILMTESKPQIRKRFTNSYPIIS